MTQATTLRRFAVALSFPGEHRAFVEQVAEHLASKFDRERILYDEFYEAEFARPDLDVYLPGLYRTESELIVMFLCPEYAAKRWCRLEWRHIRQLIATVDASRIMFLRYGYEGDLTELGILDGDGTINFQGRSAQNIAERIHERYLFNQRNAQSKPSSAVVQNGPIPADIDRIVRYAPSELIGREAETALLNETWDALGTDVADKPAVGSQAFEQNARRPEALRTQALRPHVLTFVALGGEGKTSLVAKWAAELAAKDWPGCDAVFAWSFYSQGSSEQSAASSDLFLAGALRFFGDEAMANSAGGAFEKGKRLAQIVAQQRALLILDGLEPLQYAPTSPMAGELKDQGLAALLKGLATNNNGLCVVTTRYAIPDLRAFLGKTVQEERLTRLSTAAGVELLQRLGVQGSLRKTIPAEKPVWNEYESLVEDVKGHALTLNLLGSYLRDAHAGDIRQRDLVKLAEANDEVQGGHAFHVMDTYVRWFEEDGKTEEDKAKGRRALALLQLMGLFDRHATADCLNALWKAPAISGLTEPLIGLSEAQRNLSLKRLEDARLLTVNRDAAGKLLSLDAHPLLREYFSGRMKAGGGVMKDGDNSSFIIPPSSFQEAHRRLYEHLCATTKEGDQPTLEDLQPLYQAVAHGCQAEMYLEAGSDVYEIRILKGSGDYGCYSWRQLGAHGSNLGVLVYFFEEPWRRITQTLTESRQAWLLCETVNQLRGLGRLTEALEPMRSVLEVSTRLGDWRNASVDAGILSQLNLTLGKVAEAIKDGEQAVINADRSEDMFSRMRCRAIHADALHQAGRWSEAEVRFSEAEQLQAERQPENPLLYSLYGFRYLDTLLAAPERVAWKRCLPVKGQQSALSVGSGNNISHEIDLLHDYCRAVYWHASQTLDWWLYEFTNGGPLDIAIEQLSLGRAALYNAVISSSSRRHQDIKTSSASPLLLSKLAQQELPLAVRHIDVAVSGLRRAGSQDHIPRALLTRAWLRALTGAHTGQNSAQEDLDEAWEIAERGSMKLHMADIHLYRARLFGRMKAEGGMMNDDGEAIPYPWTSPALDLAAAERLINECGYHRRDAELADAKRAILGKESDLVSG